MKKHSSPAGRSSSKRSLPPWRRPRTWFFVSVVGICLFGVALLIRRQLWQEADSLTTPVLIPPNEVKLDQFLTVGAGSPSAAAPLAPLNPTAASGPLRVSGVNGRYFADGSGQVVYLTGSHTWASFQDNGNGNPPVAFDYGKYLDFLAENNHNFFRLWTWEQARWALETADDNYWFNPQGPYVRTGPGSALDGGARWDLSKFDQGYFDRLRARVVLAGQRGMYVSVMLFDGWSVVSDQPPALNNPWKGHPYNSANNINGVNGDVNGDNNGREVHTLANGAVTALQEAYVKKVIDTLNDLDNVLYEVANEAPDESKAWQYHLVGVIHSYEAGKAKQHPVGMTGRYEWSVNDLLASGADWISPGGSAYQWDQPAGDGQAVVVVDTDHLWGIGGDYVWAWKSFTRGLNPIFMDGYDGAGYGVGGQGFNFSDPQWVKLRANLGYTRAYAQRMNLAAMTPRSDLCSTGYCLANASGPSAEYIVYQPNGANSFAVKLNGMSGSFAVEWLNPENGSKSAGAAVSGGGTVSFTPPFANAVLYLKQGLTSLTPTLPPSTPSPNTPTPTPTNSPQAQFPTSPLLDNFNRPDGHIGVNWGNQPQDFRIANRRLDLPAAGVAIWRPATFGPSQQAFVTLAAIDLYGGANHEAGIVLKAALEGDQLAGGIKVVYAPLARELRVATHSTANGWQQVGAPIKAVFSAGDVLWAHARSDDKVALFHNGIQLGSVTVGPSSISWGGQIGIVVNDPEGRARNAVVDNFGGGNADDGASLPYTLALNTSAAGQGAVEAKPSGAITCGQLITITAVPKPGWSFIGWTGDVLQSDNPLILNVYGSLILVANFTAAPPDLAIVADAQGDGAVVVKPVGPYRAGQVVELTALADPGWRFEGWNGSLQGSDNPVQRQIRSSMDVTAVFARAVALYLPAITDWQAEQAIGAQESCR